MRGEPPRSAKPRQPLRKRRHIATAAIVIWFLPLYSDVYENHIGFRRVKSSSTWLNITVGSNRPEHCLVEWFILPLRGVYREQGQ